MSLSFNELIEYTDWERAKWYDWLLKRGDDVFNNQLRAEWRRSLSERR